MKKHLLMLSAAVVAFNASADITEPVIIPGECLTQVSPDGKWAAGQNPYTNDLYIYNTETGDEVYEAVDTEDLSADMSLGSGNAMSSVGIFCICTTYSGTAAIWDNGEIKVLPTAGEQTSFSNGITPDGSRICGNVGLDMTMETVIMQRPVYWDRLEDGSYSEYKELPHPDTDWTGRTPQYFLTNCISADGKTIIGQVVDYTGFTIQPIVYREDANGEWSYELLHPELFNPDNIEFPEFPGDSPESPDAENFMTAEEYASFEEAVANFFDGMIDNYPKYIDFMTPEEAAAYTAAKEEWEVVFAEWEAKNDAFNEVYYSLVENAPQFGQNITFLSSNGRYYATAHYVAGFWGAESEGYPVIFDLETGEMYTKEMMGTVLVTTGVNNEGGIFAAQSVMDYGRNAWYSATAADNLEPLNEYVQKTDKTLYTWMEENMKHDYYSYDPETYDPILVEDQWLTGTAFADEKMDKIVSWNMNIWDYDSEDYFFSYVLPFDNASGISDIKTLSTTLNASIDHNGVVSIQGKATSLKIYDVNGRLVFDFNNPSSKVATGLSNGFYIIKAEGANGETSTKKANI